MSTCSVFPSHTYRAWLIDEGRYIQDGMLDLTTPILIQAAKKLRIDIIPIMGINIPEETASNGPGGASDLTGRSPIRRVFSAQEWPAGFFITPAVPNQHVYASSIIRWLGLENWKARQKKTLRLWWRPRAATLMIIRTLPHYFKYELGQMLKRVTHHYSVMINVVLFGCYSWLLGFIAVHMQDSWIQLLRDNYFFLAIVVVLVMDIWLAFCRPWLRHRN
jgi:hypothetical protein